MEEKIFYDIKPGDDGQPFFSEEPIKVLLTADQNEKYKPKKKNYPKDLKAIYNGKLVRWITNYGLKLKGSDPDEFIGKLPNDETYEIEVTNLKENEILVYFSKGEIIPFKETDFTEPNRVKISEGDPPIGISTA